MGYFEINHDTQAIIYGAGQMGCMHREKLKRWCRVVAFFDIYPEKAASRVPVPVYNPFAEEECLAGKQTVVIVCLHTSAVHDEVAGNLYARGYKNILFIPEDNRSYGTDAMKRMQECYCAFCEEDYSVLRGIPDYEVMTKMQYRANIIRSTEKYVTTLISPDLLYIGGEKQPDQRKKRDDPDCSPEYRDAYDAFGRYTNKPLAMFRLYRDLFRAFLYGGEISEEYSRVCKQVQNMGTLTDEEFLKSRFKVFAMLERKFHNGLQGFYQCPVETEWNPKGYFETIDGNHRAVYLYCKMSSRIPVRMKMEDYLAWEKKTEGEKLIEEYGGMAFSAPVLNPLYMELSYRGQIYLQRNLYAIFEFLGIRQYENLRFIDLGCDNGYYARCFWQLGVTKATVVEEDEQTREMDVALNRLMTGQAGDVRYCMDRYDFEGNYDIAYINEDASRRELKSIVQRLERKVNGMLIWFCPVDLNVDSCVLQYSGFRYGRRLRRLMLDGHFWELVVFSRNIRFDLGKGGSER